MSGLDELSPPDEDRRQRRGPSPFDPRLRFDRYLLIWNAAAPHELRRFEVVPPVHAEPILRRLIEQADDDMWDRLFSFYCRATHLHGVPLLQEHYDDIERWLPRQIHGRFARAQLFKRKPLEFTGRFAEQVPEEQAGDAPPEAHWVGLDLVDQDGNPVPEAEYQLRLPDERVVKRATRNGGATKVDGIERAGSSEWKLLDKQPEPGA